MRDWVTLYSGNEASAESLSRYLADRSLEVCKSSKRGPIVSKAGRRSRFVLVQVPADQLESARSLYAEWQIRHEARARAASRRVLSILILSLLAPAAWVLAYFAKVPGAPFPEPALVFFVWMAFLVVIAQVESRRRRTETIGAEEAGHAR
jgi:hypothetical protein